MSQSGEDVAVPSADDTADEVLARRLAATMTVRELREWCRDHGVQRKRGDDKLQTAVRAVEQSPQAAVEELDRQKKET